MSITNMNEVNDNNRSLIVMVIVDKIQRHKPCFTSQIAVCLENCKLTLPEAIISDLKKSKVDL